MHPLDAFVLFPMIFGLAFWPAIFFWSLVAVIFVELCFDQGIAAFVTVVAAVFASYYLGFWSVGFVQAHQTAFLWLLAFYIPIGIVWATFRWYPLYVFGVRNKVLRHIAKKTKEHTSNGIENAEALKRARDSLSYTFEELPPRVLNHKADFMRWMGWWPFSIVTWMLGDMLRELFTAIYEGFGNMWQAMSNHAFRNVEFANPPDDPPTSPPSRTRG